MTTTLATDPSPPKTKRWSIRWPGLFVPLATVISLITSVNAAILGIGLGPQNRGIGFAMAVIVFPIICAFLLNYTLGNKRPWLFLLYQFCACLLIAGLAWYVNNWRWS